MKVHSALADMDISIGEVRREGAELVLASGAGSSLDTTIRIDAREALRILGRVLGSAGGLGFVLGLPFLALRRPATANAAGAARGRAAAPADINKPW